MRRTSVTARPKTIGSGALLGPTAPALVIPGLRRTGRLGPACAGRAKSLRGDPKAIRDHHRGPLEASRAGAPAPRCPRQATIRQQRALILCSRQPMLTADRPQVTPKSGKDVRSASYCQLTTNQVPSKRVLDPKSRSVRPI